MNRIDSIFENSRLFAKKITGRLTEQEEEIFDQWINNSPQNQKFYKKIQDNENFQARNDQFESINTKRAWDEFSMKIKIRKRNKSVSMFLKYAAIVFFPILIGTATYYFIGRYGQQKDNTSVISMIKPGFRNAILVLNNGQNIDLCKQENATIKEADGSVINKLNNELNYLNNQSAKSKKELRNTLLIAKGGEYSIVLSDSTKVFLNSMSRLVYPVKFSGDKREVTLEGEAYFEVRKDRQHPFIVTVNGMQINVLGTSFNVNAYPDELKVYTTLVEGKVMINPANQEDKKWILEPNQQAAFGRSDSEVKISDVDAKLYMQWTKGTYTFTDQPLDEIMKSLSRWYDFTYSFSDESLKTIRFEGGLNKYESIEPILDIITRTGKVTYKIKGREIIFTK
jgi:ferric-dicitrate binding protein FerR (iron transport regulator)